MLKAISTHIHLRERLHPGILDRLASGGAQGVEVFAMRGHFDYEDRQQVREVASWFGSQSEVVFQSMHAPMWSCQFRERLETAQLNIAGRERQERISAMDEIKRAIAVAETIPFRFLILHAGVSGEEFDEHKYEGALTSLEHLRAFAAPLGVRLLLENIPNELTTPARLVELIRNLHGEVGVCLDVGHANMAPGVEAAMEALKPHIRSVHVHDNHGQKDEHLWPGEGTIDWKRLMEGLRTAPQLPALVLEVAGDPNGDPAFGKTVPAKMQAAWKTLEA